MLKEILALLKIGEQTPTAIDYFYMPPSRQWVPNEVLKKAHQNQNFLMSVIGLHNLSSKVLSSIRIKLPIDPTYEPVIDVMGSPILVNYVKQIHEIQIEKLDPGEQIYVSIFLLQDEKQLFQEPQVIIKDQLLSRGMRFVGFLKGSPKVALMLGSLFAITLSVVVFTGFVMFKLSPLNPKIKAVNDAMADYSGCQPKAYEKAQVNETLLARHKLGEPFLLRSNRVLIRKDLFDKDHVVICE